MNALFAAAAGVQAFCAARGWQCCVIESLAVQRWDDPRQTRDVDLTLLEGIIVRQGARLDRSLVLQELGPLLELKEDLKAQVTLGSLFAKHLP